MRTLLLLRHGQAHGNTHADHERPLNAEGIAAARLIGRFITASIGAPDRVLTSSAVRARTTAELAAEAGEWSPSMEVCEALYTSTVDTVLDHAAQAEDSVASQLLVGHQPVWSATVSRLVGGGEMSMPPAGLACIQLSLKRWSALPRSSGALAWLITPEVLQSLVVEGVSQR